MTVHQGAPQRIVAWGDSLTAGRLAGVGNSYPEQLALLFDPPRPVLNRGIGQQTADMICARLLKEPELFGEIVIIWAGTGDLVASPEAVQPAIARMVAALKGNRRFLVLSVMNTDRPRQWRGGDVHGRLMRLNAALARTYKTNFLDVRAALVAAYSADDATDRTDFEHDVPPTSLRVDKGHLNAAGNLVVAEAVFRMIGAL